MLSSLDAFMQTWISCYKVHTLSLKQTQTTLTHTHTHTHTHTQHANIHTHQCSLILSMQWEEEGPDRVCMDKPVVAAHV